MIKLFRITKKQPENFYTETVRAIHDCTDITSVTCIQNAIESNLNSFYTSNKDKAKYWLLLAHANMKIKYLTMQLRSQSNQIQQSFN